MKKLLAVLLIAVMTLSGCSKPAAPTETGAPATGTPVEGGSITVNLGSEPPKLNPLLSTDSTSGNVIRHIFEGLVVLDQDDLPQPGVAESWVISEDGLTYTFNLRKDAKWSDGVALTANDFAFAWKTVLTAETAAEYSYFLYAIEGGEAYNTGKGTWEDVAVKVIDDNTLEVKLIAPTSYFLSQLAFQTFMPVREDYYTANFATEANNAIYNGPYMLTEWVHDDHLTMTKNPEYVGDLKPAIDEIKMMMILDTNTSYNAYLAGDLDLVGLTGPQVAQIAIDKPEATIDQYSNGSSWVVAFNHARELTANENLRKALTLSIDRQTFITNILKNNSQPAFTWTTPDISLNGQQFVSVVKTPITDNDIEGAKAALELAKQELGVTEIKLNLVTDDGDSARDNATYLQACFQNIGVTVEITQLPFKERLERQNTGEYDLSLYGWGPDYNDPMTFLDLWVTGSGNNIIKFSDEKFDANIAASMIEPDTAKRAELLIECEEILVGGYHIAPIYFHMRDYTTSAKLQGVYRSTFQDMNYVWAYVTE